MAFRDGLSMNSWKQYNFESPDEMRSYILQQLHLRNERISLGACIDAKPSFSQCGEDLIVAYIFTALGINHGNYLDVGGHHPFHLNNTFYFYQRGWRGVNVDPICERIELFKIKRPEDISICAGLGGKDQIKEFYLMDAETLSTFDHDIYKAYLAAGHSLKEKRNIRFVNVKTFLAEVGISNIDLLSVDIEGDDKAIVSEVVDCGIRPKVIICESVFYSKNIDIKKKNTDVVRSIEALGYEVYADTFVNTIFVNKEILM